MRHEHHREVDSTNAEALRRAASCGDDPLLVSADAQTAGRGRGGRAWASPAGGAYFSLVWPWRGRPGDAELAPLAAGLAVRGVLIDRFGVAGDRLRVKWPNDLLYDDRKLGGVLCERVVVGSGVRAGPLVVGVGVNVDVEPDDEAATGFRLPPAALAEAAAHAVSVRDVVVEAGGAVATALGRLQAHGWTDDDARTLDRALAWRGCTVSVDRRGGDGESVEDSWSESDTATVGVVVGVDERGRLLLRPPGVDTPVAVRSGEAVRLSPAPPDDPKPNPEGATQ